ncbi:hypothetical protein [Desulfoglaeba alkanexedens]|uniref:Uncharacterized protein n=1 Tax=Desulfoglaeba alkanexedens ALDC TaxID=980445 RepID=A0A4P8L5A1_9BACT|nr:hypothetical protein [Desulfoglaeba alkanexedens]QCQ23158.1 hypothetical protein FDQ92_13835 [Desulfoglaeba alkanexedens ALDC]
MELANRGGPKDLKLEHAAGLSADLPTNMLSVIDTSVKWHLFSFKHQYKDFAHNLCFVCSLLISARTKTPLFTMAGIKFPLVPKLWLGNGITEAGASAQLCSQAGAWEQEAKDLHLSPGFRYPR